MSTSTTESVLILHNEMVGQLSTIYGGLLVTLCIATEATTIFTDSITSIFYNGFYIYCTCISIVFLCYVQICIRKKSDAKTTKPPAHFEMEVFDKSKELTRQLGVTNNKSHISILSMSGLLMFGIGSVIFSGLFVGRFIEFYFTTIGYCHVNITEIIVSSAKLAFTFIQMYFIFNNSKLNIHHRQGVARFGLIHMIATNICIWMNALIQETMHALEESGHVTHGANNISNVSCNLNDTYMDQIIVKSHNYLLPMVIEYSIICCAMLYVMWKHVGHTPPATSSNSLKGVLKLDLVGSSKGFFGGLIIFTFAIINILLFLILDESNEDDSKDNIETFLSDLGHFTILLISIVATIIGFVKIRRLPMTRESDESELLNIQLYIPVFGWYLYSIFLILAGTLGDHSTYLTATTMTLGYSSILQITLQLIFISDITRRKVNTNECMHRPGRNIVTLLFMCNFTLWLMYIFEVQKMKANQVGINFYGHVTWACILRLTLPLGIFFRFHSAVVMLEIWKNVYKTKIMCNDK